MLVLRLFLVRIERYPADSDDIVLLLLDVGLYLVPPEREDEAEV
jgi:hypothetical protein